MKMRAGGDWGCVGIAAQVRVKIELKRSFPQLPHAYAKWPETSPSKRACGKESFFGTPTPQSAVFDHMPRGGYAPPDPPARACGARAKR